MSPKHSVRRHGGALLGLNPETLRDWFEEPERVESGRSQAPRSAESDEVRTPEPSDRGVEAANEILKTSAALSAMRSSTAD